MTEAEELTAARIAALVPRRKPEDHKGVYGHVLLLAGSRGFTGAARLAAEAALRSGVGLVTLAVPSPLADIAAMGPPEAMTLPLPATEAESFASNALEPALAAAAQRTAVGLGPGCGLHSETVAFVHRFVAQCPVPFVLDADGLNAVSRDRGVLKSRVAPAVLTPHPGEMARLLGITTRDVQADRRAAATQLAQETRCVVVLKGHRTVIAAEDGRLAINPTGNPGMATGGTGDVLTGLLAGLLAQRMAPFDAACVAVYLHGLAGDLAAARYTQPALVAGDLVRMLPEAWRRIEPA
jgi:hydroxyethylthiazole kinase-like uncharacterized protein yjeF